MNEVRLLILTSKVVLWPLHMCAHRAHAPAHTEIHIYSNIIKGGWTQEWCLGLISDIPYAKRRRRRVNHSVHEFFSADIFLGHFIGPVMIKYPNPFYSPCLMRKIQALLMWHFLIPLPNVHCDNWDCFIFIYKMTNIILHLPWSFSSNLLHLLKNSY